MSRNNLTTASPRRPRLLPGSVSWLALIVVASAVGLALGLLAPRRIDERWRPLFEPLACVSHGALAALLVALSSDALRLRKWSRDLDAFAHGDDSRPTWAAEALQFCHEQFDHIPTPDTVQVKLREWRDIWEGRMEWRSNTFLILGFLLGLPLELSALERVADGGSDPRAALRASIAPLALGGLEVLAVGLPSLMIRRGWHEVFETWVAAAGRESNRRRFVSYAGPSPSPSPTAPPPQPRQESKPLQPEPPHEAGTSYAMTETQPDDSPLVTDDDWDFDVK